VFSVLTAMYHVHRFKVGIETKLHHYQKLLEKVIPGGFVISLRLSPFGQYLPSGMDKMGQPKRHEVTH